LAERLRELTREKSADDARNAQDEPGQQEKAAHPPDSTENGRKVDVASGDSLDKHPSSQEPANGSLAGAPPAEAVASPANATLPEASRSERDSESESPGVQEGSPVSPEASNEPHGVELQTSDAKPDDARAGSDEALRHSLSAFPASTEVGCLSLERVDASDHGAEASGQASAAPAGEMPPDFRNVSREFEADLQSRFNQALADLERRIASEALVEEVAGPLEERIRVAANGIFKEAQNQTWMMHNAVAGELHTFRDQFAKEIQERSGLLDRATRQALELKESLEESLRKGEEALRSLSIAGKETTSQFQTASDVFDNHLRESREALSREISAHRDALEKLRQSVRQDELQLKEEVEKFRSDATAACELVARRTDESLDRLNSTAADVHTKTHDGLERLRADTERRFQSAGLVEKATEHLADATQQIVEPSLERIRKAAQDADSSMSALANHEIQILRQLDAARDEIDSRLQSLLGNQLQLLDATMAGFQSKASEELGKFVERIVAQSSEQLGERLHGMFQDLLTTSSREINGAARTTLSTLHSGLRDIFDPHVPRNGDGEPLK
jgi:hypothetical protein